MRQKTFKIIESTLVQYQKNSSDRNTKSTDPTTGTVTTSTITGMGFAKPSKR